MNSLIPVSRKDSTSRSKAPGPAQGSSGGHITSERRRLSESGPGAGPRCRPGTSEKSLVEEVHHQPIEVVWALQRHHV